MQEYSKSSPPHSEQTTQVTTQSSPSSTEKTRKLSEKLIQTPALNLSSLERAALRTPPSLAISEGRRAVTLANIGASLRHLGASEDVLKIALNAFNSIQCKPPLTKEEFQRLLAFILEKQDNLLQESTKEAISSFPPLQRIEDLLTMKQPGLEWIVPDLLPEGVTLLTGKTRVGKTWLGLGLALAVANGAPVLGKFPAQRGEVLFLGLKESPWHTAARMRTLLDRQEAPRGFTWAGKWAELNAGGLADLEDWLVGHPEARLVVIDPLEEVAMPESLQYREQRHETTILTSLKVMAESYHVAILVVCRPYKAAEITVQRKTIVLQDLEKAFESAITLYSETSYAPLQLRVSNRYKEERRLTLEFEQGLWRVIEE